MASQFRTKLLKDGFSMMQYSVYIRHCASRESSLVHVKRIKSMLLTSGKVSVVQITDKQYGLILNYWGKSDKSLEKPPNQLEMF